MFRCEPLNGRTCCREVSVLRGGRQTCTTSGEWHRPPLFGQRSGDKKCRYSSQGCWGLGREGSWTGYCRKMLTGSGAIMCRVLVLCSVQGYRQRRRSPPNGSVATWPKAKTQAVDINTYMCVCKTDILASSRQFAYTGNDTAQQESVNTIKGS